jgi:murein DD-endopeptidase MepM/ murein hydrolase activator NlpD
VSTTATLPRSAHAVWSEQRSLATNTIVALLIAVVGLLAAGSLSLTTSADEGTVRQTRAQPAQADPVAVGRRSAALQSALLAEAAAQRGDALAKDAEASARDSLSAAGTARQQQLTTAQVDAGVQADPTQPGTTLPGTTLPDTTLGGQATTPVTGTAGTLPAGTQGVLPISSGVVGAKFGAYGHWSKYHTGLDFRAASGTPIHAVLPGVVLYAGNSGDWAGNHVAVRHADGRTTMYSHMSRMAVSTGATVQAGQVIGYVGQTGRAFGAHLHFELYPSGVRYGDVYHAVDPTPWLQSIGVRTH